MLELIVRDFDICQISKLLGKNKIKARITDSTIIIESEGISDEVLENLLKSTTIIAAQNFHETIDTPSIENAELEEVSSKPVDQVEKENEPPIKYEEEAIDSEYHAEDSTNRVTQEDVEAEEVVILRNKIPKSEMVYRGEVFRWGEVRNYDGREGSTVKECVIIIQNDYQRSASEETIALFCTSCYEDRAPFHFSFQFTEGTMMDYSRRRLGQFDSCTLFVGHIKGLNRNNLGEYLGTMNDAFMNTLQPTIDFCLGIKRSRTVNWAQLRMLSTVDMKELFEISDSKISRAEKVEEFLKLFKFDMSKDGVQYVKKAILIASTRGDYKLEDLAEIIAQKENVEAKEVLRMIVARIKENFQFKKSPAISFIRLIDKLLRKG